MPEYLVCNYYCSSVIHKVTADNADDALEIGRDMDDDLEQLTESLAFEDSMVLQ